MTEGRHLLNKRIELARDFFGNLIVLCEKCDRMNEEGKPWCCVWAKGMFWSYVYGRIQEHENTRSRKTAYVQKKTGGKNAHS